MPFTVEEIDAIFDPILTVTATYIPQGGESKTISVIFINNYEAVSPLGEVGVESAYCEAHCKNADIAGVRQGDRLIINSITYYVAEIQRDDITVLVLSKER